MGHIRNDIKLSFINYETKFFVNDKKRIVTCTVTAIIKAPWGMDTHFNLPYGKEVKGVGNAKCMEGDTFDLERGKRIALARAENRAYLNALHMLNEYRKDLQFLINSIDVFEDKTYHCCAHNEDYIQSLSYEAHPEYKKELKPLKTEE